MSTLSPHLATHAPRAFEGQAGTVLWTLFGLACVFYAALAFDYFISFANGRDGLWLRLFAALVSHDQAFGAGSVHVDQRLPYTQGLNFMLMHTTMGAVGMALGPFQFITALRRRWPALHRTSGKIYLSAVVLSMAAGLTYLGTTRLTAIYSGPPFGVALIGLDLMVLVSAGLAYVAIRQRDVPRHRA